MITGYVVIVRGTDVKFHNLVFRPESMKFDTLVLNLVRINFKIRAHPSDPPESTTVEEERVQVGA